MVGKALAPSFASFGIRTSASAWVLDAAIWQTSFSAGSFCVQGAAQATEEQSSRAVKAPHNEILFNTAVIPVCELSGNIHEYSHRGQCQRMLA